MNEFEIVKHIMMKDHVSYDDLSKRLGYKSKANSYQRLAGKHIQVDTWRRFLNELGYDIVVCKHDGTGEKFVVTDDYMPSPLRFQGMSLDFESMLSPVPKSTPDATAHTHTNSESNGRNLLKELTSDFIMED